MTTADVTVVDAGTSPDKANALVGAVLADATQVEVPDIEEAPDTVVNLPAGYLTPDGELLTVAEVRELTGEDEEALAKAASSRNLLKVTNVILQRGVVNIGGVPADAKLLNNLLVGDREALVAGVRKATYGKVVDLDVVCPACQNKMSVGVDLDADVPIKKLDDANQRTFRLDLRNGYCEVSLPTGNTQDYVSNSQAKTPAEINTVLLGQVVESINGEPVVGLGPVRRLGMKDRKTILDFITEKQPGPQYEDVKQECDACSREIPLPLDLGDLFRG